MIISTLLIAVWFYLHYSNLKTPIRKTFTTDTNTYMASFSSNSWFEKVKCQLVENMCEALLPKPSLSNLLQYFYRNRFLVISGIVCKKTISTILPLTFERVVGLRWDFCHFYKRNHHWENFFPTSSGFLEEKNVLTWTNVAGLKEQHTKAFEKNIHSIKSQEGVGVDWLLVLGH